MLLRSAMNLQALDAVSAVLTPTSITLIRPDGSTHHWNIPDSTPTDIDSPQTSPSPSATSPAPDSPAPVGEFSLDLPEDDPAIAVLFPSPVPDPPSSPQPVLDDAQPQQVPAVLPMPAAPALPLDSDLPDDEVMGNVVTDLCNYHLSRVTLNLVLPTNTQEALNTLFTRHDHEAQRLHPNRHHQLHLAYLLGQQLETDPSAVRRLAAVRYPNARSRRCFLTGIQRTHEVIHHLGLPWAYGTRHITPRLLGRLTSPQYEERIWPTLPSLTIGPRPPGSEDLTFF